MLLRDSAQLSTIAGRNVGRDCPPSLFETFYIQECRSNSRVNFDNDGQKEGLEGTKERILIESRYANQRTSVLSTASGLYHFMLWIPRAAPLHRALAPVSRGDWLAGWLAIWPSSFSGGHRFCFLQDLNFSMRLIRENLSSPRREEN